ATLDDTQTTKDLVALTYLRRLNRAWWSPCHGLRGPPRGRRMSSALSPYKNQSTPP
ncbi:unnamed protein product, partial [Caretta caretta]